ncbi:MAG: hypothetical protein ACK5P5_08705 [Pseudobdellovibrionaceae bacterium]
MSFASSLLTLSILNLIFCCIAFATPFYRFQNSAFPSGDAPLEKLLQKVVSKDTQVQFKISWDEREFLMAKSDLLFDMEVSEKTITAQSSYLLEEPDFNGKKILKMPADKPAKILKSLQLWLYVEVVHETERLRGWIHAQDVKSDETDFGFYRSLIELKLKEKPDAFSATISHVPKLTALRSIEELHQWIKVKYDDKEGYLNKQYLISKIDFADSVLDNNGEWRKVKKIKNDQVIVKIGKEQKAIPIKKLIKLRTDDTRVFVLRSADIPASPQVGSKAMIVEKRGEIWYQSILDGHNRVWWTEKKEKTKTVTLTDQEFRRKKINSISLIDTGEVIGLASSNGIYKTDNGQSWERIETFQNLEYPVLAHPNGTLFVGPYRSENSGESFEPFIKWDELASLIKEKYDYDPKFFKMTKMEYVSDSQIKLTIDVGLRKVKILSSVSGLQMKLVK